jgi:hypothetical protein
MPNGKLTKKHSPVKAVRSTKQQPLAFTEREYSSLQHAYDFFNRDLFNGTLPQLLVTLQRRANSRGYFSPDRFQSRTGSSGTHELALNPNTFPGRTDEDILSTLVHEMVHHQQHLHGHPGRPGYHNKEFAALMSQIGLHTSSTGYPGGKTTGQGMSHYILAGGPFQTACHKLLATGWTLNWESLGDTNSHKKSPSKAKFTCPDCGLNMWGIPTGRIKCDLCPHNPGMICVSSDTGNAAATPT